MSGTASMARGLSAVACLDFAHIFGIKPERIRTNKLSESIVVNQLAAAREVDPYEGVSALSSEVDVQRLHQLLGLPTSVVQDARCAASRMHYATSPILIPILPKKKII